MTGLRLWIGALVVVAFLAGTGAGVLLGLSLAPSAQERGPFADYEALLVREFELSPLRARGLRAVLERYHREIEDLKSKHLAGIERELEDRGLDCRRRIRDKVLPPDRRARFDELALGAAPADPWLPTAER